MIYFTSLHLLTKANYISLPAFYRVEMYNLGGWELQIIANNTTNSVVVEGREEEEKEKKSRKKVMHLPV